MVAPRVLLGGRGATGACGAVSAFEGASDLVLRMLRKGYRRADLARALEICPAAGLPLRPTWVAFTPWTTYDDYLDMLAWVRARRLVGHIPPVQFGVRLLVPPKSALLDEDAAGYFEELDRANFGYSWRHPDARMDELHRQVIAVVEDDDGCSPQALFEQIEQLAYGFGEAAAPAAGEELVPVPVPRLTEEWFC